MNHHILVEGQFKAQYLPPTFFDADVFWGLRLISNSPELVAARPAKQPCHMQIPCFQVEGFATIKHFDSVDINFLLRQQEHLKYLSAGSNDLTEWSARYLGLH